jgi:branched-chain amino acid transport system substrate-binding protein
MRNRSSRPGVIQALGPVLAAALVGLVLYLALAPRTAVVGSDDPQLVRIYTSVPMNRFASIVHGVQMALDEAGSRAGNFRVELVPLNGAPEIGGKWTTEVELANARHAVEDPSAMVYIGTYNSGAAKISIPVLNRVRMAMISPGNTYPGLTKPGTGTAGEPFVYYPLGERNYFRVVPADDLQGSAAAAYANQAGLKSVYVLDDTELYGHGIAMIFAQSARSLGMQVVGGPEGIDVRASSYGALVQKIIAANPDLVYFGGITDNHAGMVLRDLRAAGFSGAFMGADGIQDSTFVQQAQERGADIGDVYATTVGLPASRMSGPGEVWYRQYKARYPNDENENFAPFGYEAAKVALRAIEKAGKKDREAIRSAVATVSSDDLPGEHILGSWKFDANGDTSLVNISVLKQVEQPGSDPWSYQGLMLFDAQKRDWSYQPGQ